MLAPCVLHFGGALSWVTFHAGHLADGQPPPPTPLPKPPQPQPTCPSPIRALSHCPAAVWRRSRGLRVQGRALWPGLLPGQARHKQALGWVREGGRRLWRTNSCALSWACSQLAGSWGLQQHAHLHAAPLSLSAAGEREAAAAGTQAPRGPVVTRPPIASGGAGGAAKRGRFQGKGEALDPMDPVRAAIDHQTTNIEY